MIPLNDPYYGLEEYEFIRQEAMETHLHGQRGHGLALFVTRGMVDWFNALKILMKSAFSVEHAMTSNSQVLLPSFVRSDLTLVLTNMIIACTQERH